MVMQTKMMGVFAVIIILKYQSLTLILTNDFLCKAHIPALCPIIVAAHCPVSADQTLSCVSDPPLSITTPDGKNLAVFTSNA